MKPLRPEDLREWRARHGLTQKTFALFLGVSKGAVEKWEQGANDIPPMLTMLTTVLDDSEIGRRLVARSRTEAERN